MLFFKNHAFENNKQKFLSYSNQYIDKFSREYDGFVSSDKKNILNEISRMVDSDPDYVASLNEDPEWFIEESVSYIANASYNLLFTDAYDMGGHYVNPVGYRSLWGMHTRALIWAKDHGLITQEDIDEDALAYREDRNERSHGRR